MSVAGHAAGPAAGRHATPSVSTDRFGELEDGTAIDRWHVRAGMLEMTVMTYGATILSLRAPDRAGVLDDVVLGFDRLEDYVCCSPYFGAVVGRYGNRIAAGRFSLDGERYALAVNNGANHLHGGPDGFHRRAWQAAPIERHDAAGVSFTRTSPHGEEGYPGTLHARVDYVLTARNELAIAYQATTDRPTIVNLTQHSYFDLSAGRAADVGGHELTLAASRIVAVDEGLIPTGELMPVAQTPFDFRRSTAIGARVREAHEQLRFAGGYDHTFVLDAPGAPGSLAHAAHVAEPLSGRTLDVRTSEPGVQLYSGNFLDGTLRGKHGRVYRHRAGFCLETHHFPDSPNHPEFPSVVLRPGDVYRSRTVYTFGREEA